MEIPIRHTAVGYKLYTKRTEAVKVHLKYKYNLVSLGFSLHNCFLLALRSDERWVISSHFTTYVVNTYRGLLPFFGESRRPPARCDPSATPGTGCSRCSTGLG